MHNSLVEIPREGLVLLRRQVETVRVLFQRDASDDERASAVAEHRRLSEILSEKYEGYKAGYEAGALPDPCVPWHVLFIQRPNPFFAWHARQVARQASLPTPEWAEAALDKQFKAALNHANDPDSHVLDVADALQITVTGGPTRMEQYAIAIERTDSVRMVLNEMFCDAVQCAIRGGRPRSIATLIDLVAHARQVGHRFMKTAFYDLTQPTPPGSAVPRMFRDCPCKKQPSV